MLNKSYIELLNNLEYDPNYKDGLLESESIGLANQEWFDSFYLELALGCLLILIDELWPAVIKFCTKSNTNHTLVLDFISNQTMVGRFSHPHELQTIVIVYTDTFKLWFTCYLWKVIYKEINMIRDFENDENEGIALWDISLGRPTLFEI